MILVSEKEVLYSHFKFNNISSELFDLLSKNPKEIDTCFEDNTFICFKKNTIIRVNNQSNIEPRKGEILLFKIRKDKSTNDYLLENPIPTKISEDSSNSLNIKLWYILNNEKSDNNDGIININDNYYLCEKDIAKFGNIKYIIQEISLDVKLKLTISNSINNNSEITYTEENTESSQENQENQISQEKQVNYNINSLNDNSADIFDFLPTLKEYYIEGKKDKDYVVCGICKQKKYKKENPLIKLCSCNFVHFNCVKKIIKLKAKIIDTENAKNYYLKGLNCKKCHTIYPLKFKILDNIYQFYEIEKPTDSDYMIFESVESKMYYGHMKLIHVIKLNDNIIKIGRKGGINDVIICDPSVSKEHAFIKYNKEKGKILLSNISKKFGTLILIKKSLKINEQKIQIQIGKVFIEARTMKFGEFQKIKNKNTKYPLPKKD